MKTSVIGYPRIGERRELKFACEKYFAGKITAEELEEAAAKLRLSNLEEQKKSGLDYIPSNDFSFCDGMLDTAVMLGVVPARYRALGLSALDEYFAMARGYQGSGGDVKALAMKKWFNTNYHYMVPETDDDTVISLNGEKPCTLFSEALSRGVVTKPVLTGAYTFLKLARHTGRRGAEDFAAPVAAAYRRLLEELCSLGAGWVQIDEPALVLDMTEGDRRLFRGLYADILGGRRCKVLLQTYFGDVRDCYGDICSLPFEGVGLDFAEGKRSLDLVRSGFPEDKVLFAGVVNGKNIWRNDYAATVALVKELSSLCGGVVTGTSCSLLHVPYSVGGETRLPQELKDRLAFAREKLGELAALKRILNSPEPEKTAEYAANTALHSRPCAEADKSVRAAVAALKEEDFTRQPPFEERERLQREQLGLPLLPTTTIGSFPQTADVKAARLRLKRGEITAGEYEEFIKGKIAACIALQEEIGLDVLVHGEYERNDMVEYFGERLNGFAFTQNAWVQSYGTRCVKPPIICGDISRRGTITAEWSAYAQSLTQKPVKGMLTGPVTILNWSFPREDIPLKDMAFQLALAIREEAQELESRGIRIIQVDEAALREKLPLRKADRGDYLGWAIPAFRLVHSGLSAKTQVHTHMCYSEFGDIIREIDDMDADVITFEASRSDLAILDDLQKNNFRTQVGPGVYDIHSPRVPSRGEIEQALYRMLQKIPAGKLWVNPDCGLKTRGEEETVPALKNLVAAARAVRAKLAERNE